MLRGGSWINDARNVRSANRNDNDPANRNDNIGFRCARAQTRIGWSASEQVCFHGVAASGRCSPQHDGGRRAGRMAGWPSEGSPACRAPNGVMVVIDASWHPLAQGVPPAWASAWGQDRFGVYAAFTLAGVNQRLRWISPGRFQMGSPADEAGRWDDEGPRHAVAISKGFWLFETACTEALWQAVTGTPPVPARGAKMPVTGVSWHDAQSFIERIQVMKPGLDLRLPSEAEWEYACRAGADTPWSFGTEITTEQVCFGARAPVDTGSLPPNPWGLREMHGNVWEWCADHWHNDYRGAPDDGSAWLDPRASRAARRVLRGGSWFGGARNVRSADRYGRDPAGRDDGIGFRCARVQ